jgi:ribonucleotide reductase beta subunit family protein with ferritin-like domain
MFSGCFCAIEWLASRGLLPGLKQANELIRIDEGQHTDAGLALFVILLTQNGAMNDPRIKKEVLGIVEEAVAIASKFTAAALTVDLPEMNSRLMTQYIKSVANNLLVSINYSPIYDARDPFPFSRGINYDTKANFFERRNTAYQKSKNNGAFAIDMNF